MFPELRIARGKLIYRYSPNIFTFHFPLFVFSFPLLVVSFSYFSVKLVKVVNTIKPEPEIAARYEERYRKFAQIYPTVKELFPEIQ